jgi:hypothetical protein
MCSLTSPLFPLLTVPNILLTSHESDFLDTKISQYLQQPTFPQISPTHEPSSEINPNLPALTSLPIPLLTGPSPTPQPNTPSSPSSAASHSPTRPPTSLEAHTPNPATSTPSPSLLGLPHAA